MNNSRFLKARLNLEQKRAVKYEGGPLLIVAGAGTGKTRVITERIKWLIQEKKAKPSEILTLTFTEKAAEEMLNRVDVAMPLGYEEPYLSTFHSFCDRILRWEGLEIGLDPAYKILTPPQAWLFVRRNLFKFDLKYYRPLGNPTKFIRAMLTLFSRAQDEDVGSEEFLEYAKSVVATLVVASGKAGTSPATTEESEKTLELANTYKTYQELKVAESRLDFGDLISWTLKLFRERPSVLKKYQKQFQYILVDEFQDTNYAQYQLIKLLAPAKANPNLTVCADDDQSIYKFRGASVSNVLTFKKDYPQATVVVLTKDYRNSQKIIDATYKLIQENNPDRLEKKLKISKKLKGQKGEGLEPEILVAETGEGEAELVVRKIIELVEDEEQPHTWRDFAILARANAHLDPFVSALKRAKIPYQLVSNRGLFDQEEVKDLISFLRVLADPLDNVSFYRLLSIEVFKIKPELIGRILALSKRLRKPLWEIAKAQELKDEFFKNLINLVEKGQLEAAKKPISQLLYDFVLKSGYIKPLLEKETIENNLKIKNINLFFEKVKQFETETSSVQSLGMGVSDFVEYLDLLIEAGESPAQAEIEDIDTVNLLTVHSAKGLEFPVVFLVSLTSDRFPTRRRGDPIPLPDPLIKEILPLGDEHLSEERRLFYVGATRAKERLFLSWAKNYGGVKVKKPSGFIKELGLESLKPEARSLGERKMETLPLFDLESQAPSVTSSPKPQAPSLKYVSYSQLETFSQCPLKYKYRYILGLPTPPSHALSFGQTIHRTLRDFHRRDLFSKDASLAYLLDLYKNHWIGEGYESSEHQEERFKEGKKFLKTYFKKHREILGEPLYLEKKFTLKLEKCPLVGSVDRIDETKDGFEVVDYKTGKVKEQKAVDKDVQLTIYGLAARDALGIKPSSLALYFLEENKKVTTKRTDRQLEEERGKLVKLIKLIGESSFSPKISKLCEFCGYKTICPAYKVGRL